MRKLYAGLFAFLFTFLAPTNAWSSGDNIIVSSGVAGQAGKAYLKDNSGNLYPLAVGYTTDGNNTVLTLNGATIASDDIITNGYGGSYLQDSLSRLIPMQVCMTTDGNNNVIPISGGGGGGGVTAVTGTAPVVSSGGTTPAISMAAATTSVDGYLKHQDWTTFNGKQAALGYTPANKAGDTFSGDITVPDITVNTNAGGTQWEIFGSDGHFSFNNGLITSDTSGNLTVGSSGNDRSFYFGGTNAGINWASSGAKLFYSAGDLLMYPAGISSGIDLQNATGYVGIMKSPSYPLDVNGTVNASAVLLPGGDVQTQINAPAVNRVYVDLLNGNDSSGIGTIQRPWKTMAHAFASISPNINEPYTVYISGGNNDTDSGTINMPADVTLQADYAIQLAGNYVVGGTQNDTVTLNNISFLGTFTWSRNDGTEFSLGINNSGFFGAFDFEQAGSGKAATFLLASGDNVSFDGGLTIQAGETIFQSVGLIYGTLNYVDSGAAYFYLSGSDLYAANIELNGGITANFYANFPEGGSTITGTTTGSGTPAITMDSGSMPIANISGAFTLSNNVNSFLSQSVSGSQPACSANIRGLQWLVQGPPDVYQICQEVSAGVYTWTTH